jgi:predicted flap endonuclease-1-like 5' DNA nuclease
MTNLSFLGFQLNDIISELTYISEEFLEVAIKALQRMPKIRSEVLLLILILAVLLGTIILLRLRERHFRSRENEFKGLLVFKIKVREEMRELEKTIEHLQAQLQSFEGERSEKEKEIQSHRIRVRQLEALENETKDRKATLLGLKTKLQALSASESRVVTLRQHLAELEPQGERVRELDAALAGLEEQLADLQRTVAARTGGETNAGGPFFEASEAQDDLKKIHGIGPVLEQRLNEIGVTAFQQIAQFTKEDIERVANAIKSSPDRIVRDDWKGKAQKEYEEKYGKSL